MSDKTPFSLSGKTIFCTGATSGIGKACAIECAKFGAKIIATGRSQERLAETISQLPGDAHSGFVADFLEENAIEKVLSQIPEGEVFDGVVFSAGTNIVAPFGFIQEKKFEEQIRLNFSFPVMLAQALFKAKKLQKGASLVFISSISGGNVTAPATLAYTSAKSGLDGAVKSIAVDLAAKNIRANSICPGAVDTPILEALKLTEEQKNADLKRYPLKRHGKPEEIAYAAVYLLSDAAAWITGTRLVIDGGYTLL